MHTLAIGSNAARGSKALGGQHSPSHTETNSPSLNKASTDCITFIRILHHTLLSTLIMHLCIGVLWKLRCIRDTLTGIPYLPPTME
jgi:hypothetical protein